MRPESPTGLRHSWLKVSEQSSVLAKSQQKRSFLPIFSNIIFHPSIFFGKRHEGDFFLLHLISCDIGKDVTFDFQLYRVDLSAGTTGLARSPTKPGPTGRPF